MPAQWTAEVIGEIAVNCDYTPNEIEIIECAQTVIRRLLGLK